MYRYERSRGQIVESERRPHRSRSMSKGRSRSYSRTRGRSRSITRMSRAGSVQNLECCSPRRKAGFFICGLLLLLLIFGAIGSIVVLVRSPGQASVKTIDSVPVPKPIVDKEKHEEEDLLRPQALVEEKSEDEDHPKPKQVETHKSDYDMVSKIKAIAKKLKELKFSVEEDIKPEEYKPVHEDDIVSGNVSGSTSIKISEIGAVVNKFKDADIKFEPEVEADAIKKFKTFTGKYNKKFDDLVVILNKYSNFRVNYKEIEAHNKDPKNTYKKGYNKYADFSQKQFGEEISAGFKYMSNPFPRHKTTYLKGAAADTPLLKASGRSETAFDWRSEGVITPVGDQGDCGSCWAFATAGAVDAALNIKNKGEKVEVSVQHLVNCVKDGEYGCRGGFFEPTLEYIKDKGVCMSSELPFRATKKMCKEEDCKKRVKISGFKTISANKVFETLRDEGPLIIAMSVDKDFYQYESGVFNGSCKDDRPHAVLLVGYGIDKKTSHKYWIVKNSWGTDWGEEGYIKVSRDTKQKDNICKMLDDVVLPIA